MNLYVYILNGVPLTELPRWSTNRLNGNAPFVAANVRPSIDYVDVTSIENWSEFGRRTNKDYKFIRNEIKILANAIGWINLTTSEKKISAKLFVVTQSQRDELYTIKRQIKQGFLFHGSSIKARDQRWSHAKMEMMNRLEKDDWRIIDDDLNQNNLISQYINHGLEGTVEGDAVGLFDYIDARNGTPYGTGTKGLRNKNFTLTKSPNINTFTNQILDIIKNGNY